MDDQHEEVERIPWGELLASTGDGGRRYLYLAAAAVGALALAVVVTRALSSPSTPPSTSLGVVDTTAPTVPPAASAPATAAAPPTGPTATTVPPLESPTTATTIATTVATTAPVPVLYSEADLLAFPDDLGARAAVARAEWFVTDYFTADLEPNGTTDVRSALPGGVDLPTMPQDEPAGVSYVEWARAFSVEPVGDGRYRVAVAYRLLGAPEEGGFVRLPVRAVEVAVEVTPSGGSVVADLPTPVALPAGPVPAPWPADVEEVPQVVVDGAIAAAAGWGTEHRFLAAGHITGGWRVVLSAADEVGNRWPLVVRVDDSGVPLGEW